MTSVRFRPGARYSCRSIGDHDCVWRYAVLERTACFVTLEADDGLVKRCRVRVNRDGIECVDPLGRYSMSPVLRADSEVPA